jgi:hypothetical protein
MEYYLGTLWGRENEESEGMLISWSFIFRKEIIIPQKNAELAMWVWAAWEMGGKNVEKNNVRKVWKKCGK